MTEINETRLAEIEAELADPFIGSFGLAAHARADIPALCAALREAWVKREFANNAGLDIADALAMIEGRRIELEAERDVARSMQRAAENHAALDRAALRALEAECYEMHKEMARMTRVMDGLSL